MQTAFVFSIFTLLVSLSGLAQVQVISTLTPEQYVNDVLLGDGVEAFNVQLTGSATQIGHMTGAGATTVPIAEGLILSSAQASNVACSTNGDVPFGEGVNGDASLLSVANSVPPLIGQNYMVQSVNHICAVEFDFVASGDSIKFNYFFGSDEYPTWVNTQYNDVFAFFLSGPGITGPYSAPAGFPGGAINIGTLPGSNPPLPITISSVNDALNDDFYIDNIGNNQFCQNGLTTMLTAEAGGLQSGETYHIKLAIADGSDTGLESVVVIEAGSFTSNIDLSALCEDGSFNLPLGCTNVSACNYDPAAICDDGSCCFESINAYTPIPIPDDQIEGFEVDIEVSGAVPDIIGSVDDIAYVFVNMEHSFLGDLVIELICPNGNSIVLHQQGGGGTYLGEPVDNTLDPEPFGIGYNYFWTPTATNGTMAAEGGLVPTLPPGEYSSVESFENLIGCPTNGTWQLAIYDVFALDNGFVFDVDLGFGADLPELSCAHCCALPDGCTDSTACNFDPDATCDDGSCILPDGCTNELACNYNPDAQCDDGTCVLPDGCTDSTACNYSPDASCDDGSCIFPDGCTNELACNYNPDALCDDGTCVLPDGCTDSTACNYSPDASCDDGSCIFPDGCTNELACNYNPDALCDDGSCVIPDGCTDSEACNFDPDASCDDGSCIIIGDACDDGDSETMNDIVTADCDCAGEPIEDDVLGCTDVSACNYNPEATQDDGSCEYVQLYLIEGSVGPEAFSTVLYTYPSTAGSTYSWSVNNGVVFSGQGTPEVEVIWSSQGSGSLSVIETDDSNCVGETVTLDVVVLPTTIDDYKLESMRIFPNPAQTWFRIELPENFVGGYVEVISITGQRVASMHLQSRSEYVDIRHLASGMYTVHVDLQTGRTVQRLSVVR